MCQNVPRSPCRNDHHHLGWRWGGGGFTLTGALYSSFARWVILDDLAFSRLSLAFLLSLIFLHVSRFIHCLSFSFLKPKTLSAESLYTLIILSHVVPTMSWSSPSSVSRELKQFLSSMVNSCLTSGAQSLLTLKTLWCCLMVGVARNFSLILAISRWWSCRHLPTTLTSRRDLSHFLLMMTWSIWLTVFPWGDLRLSLWISLWGKTVPPIMHLLLRQNSTSLSLLSLMVPQPCHPIASSLPVSSFPTLAFKSPVISSIHVSCCGILQTSRSSCS